MRRGAFPIVAQGEGTKLPCGVVIVTQGASVPQLSRTAGLSTAALDNTQERRLQAIDPLEERAMDRLLPAVLSGDMAAYVWKINDAAYPNHNSLDVRTNERIGIVFSNATSMGHPMHFHGHDFQVLEIDGETFPERCAARSSYHQDQNTVGFDADNSGLWALHCHLLYHLVTGMFTVRKYDGADSKFWQPERQAQELANPK